MAIAWRDIFRTYAVRHIKPPEGSLKPHSLPYMGAVRQSDIYSKVQIVSTQGFGSQFAPGTEVDHYQIDAMLGQGAEATVVRAIDHTSDQHVVMKFFDPTRLGNVAAYEHFRRAAEIGKILKHPGIPQVFEVREDATIPYIVLEYMEGESLRKLVDEDYYLSVRSMPKIAKRMAEVVAYCHSHGVTHRDLKPENILVDEKDQVKIIDFGIALSRKANRVTWGQMSNPMGTPDYMAPEQVIGERGGPETDVYALGIMFYEMLAGYTPFVADNPMATLYQHLTHDVASLNEVREDVPEWLAAIVAKSIRRRKEERFHDAQALLEALENPESVDVSILTQPDPPLSAPIGVKTSIWAHPWILFVIAALTAAVVVLVAILFLSR